jgi:hypothetical protein
MASVPGGFCPFIHSSSLSNCKLISSPSRDHGVGARGIYRTLSHHHARLHNMRKKPAASAYHYSTEHWSSVSPGHRLLSSALSSSHDPACMS